MRRSNQKVDKMTRSDRERLRAELAGKAMHALLSRTETMALISKSARADGVPPVRYLCNAAIEYADILLMELDRTAEDPIKAGGTE